VFLTKSVDPVSRITKNVWPPMLKVRSATQPHRDKAGVRPYLTGARYALPSGSISAQEVPFIHGDDLSNAQVVMICDCEFRGNNTVPYSWG